MNNLVLLDGNKISGGINYITPECYSTEEREVGCWTDGKPLYEKTFDLGSDLVVPYNSWVSLGITLDANKIIETKTTATVGSFQGNILMYNDNGTWKGTSPRNTDGSYVRYLTVQYTKSTDTAGSGSWTPSGIPTVHYSTEEHVVGTWIDGSTIYEKTFDLTGTSDNLTVGDWTTVISNLTGIEKIIDAKSLQNESVISFIEYSYDSANSRLVGKSLRYNTVDYVRYLILQYTKTS